MTVRGEVLEGGCTAPVRGELQEASVLAGREKPH